MILYRAMCSEEYEASNPLSWIAGKKFKWFATKEFVTSRVQDGNFNNSKFVKGRYEHLIKYWVTDEDLRHFNKCGNREYMLSVRKSPLVRIKVMN